MDIYKNINLLISGSPNEFTLQHRIFSTSTILITLISSLFTVYSLIENHFALAVLSVLTVIAFQAMYYFSRVKYKYNKWLFMIILLLYYSVTWFLLKGISGPSLFIYIIGVITFYGIFEKEQYLTIIIVVVLNIFLVILIELNFPRTINTYFEYSNYYSVIVFIASIFFAGLILSQLKFNFSVEQQKTENEKNEIDFLHSNTLSSINYAQNIQSALLPSPKTLTNALNNCFVLYKPKEIVSGDFYWVKKTSNQTIFAVADCTGHGVPGAFMSMLGISYLNEIVLNNNALNSNEILNHLREKVKNAFTIDSNSKLQDGMDISLCIIDFEKMRLQYSGAYNPLLLIRNNKIIEYKADKQPIGLYPKEKPFSAINIELEEGDIFYMFSDGYKDQVGGIKGQKFLMKNFKELLLSIHDKSMNEQKKILDDTIENWKNAYSNKRIDSFNELEVALLSINKELIKNKVENASLLMRELKGKLYSDRKGTISEFTEMINKLKITQDAKQKIIRGANIQVDDIVIASFRI